MSAEDSMLTDDEAATFAAIWKERRWDTDGSRSGPGSTPEATALLRIILPILAQALEVESVLDLGCGDGAWMPDLPGYLGVDVVPEAVEAAGRTHRDRVYQLAALPLPHADLVICRDVLMHLPLDEAVSMLAAIRESGATWLLATTYEPGENRDVAAGEHYRIDMAREPFNLNLPRVRIPDDVVIPGKLLGLWKVNP